MGYWRGYPFSWKVLYAPRGPLLDWSNPQLRSSVLYDLELMAGQPDVLFIKIDPDVVKTVKETDSLEKQELINGRGLSLELTSRGWKYSQEQIQFPNTLIVDLQLSESELLQRMKQKTRYNIRLSKRKGIQVRQGGESDFPLLYRMYKETANRDGFIIRPPAYYYNSWGTFLQSGMAKILIAEYEGLPLSGLILYIFCNRAWYFYGMSGGEHKERMPNYLLQWEAMLLAKNLGCTSYDLWGAPSVMDESDPLWKVYRFKEGFGGKFVETVGAWDYSTKPLLYKTYTILFPIMQRMLRIKSGSARLGQAAAKNAHSHY